MEFQWNMGNTINYWLFLFAKFNVLILVKEMVSSPSWKFNKRGINKWKVSEFWIENSEYWGKENSCQF